MNQREIDPADFAMDSCCPRSVKICVAKMKRGSKMVNTVKLISHDLCKKIPIMWYCFAPKAWPQSVSVALDIPIYETRNYALFR